MRQRRQATVLSAVHNRCLEAAIRFQVDEINRGNQKAVMTLLKQSQEEGVVNE